jgi:hypothetical protein
MFAVRRRVSWMVCLWLACQVAGVVAAPLAFCCQSGAAADDDEECCPGLLPGQICPMHHTRQGDRSCKMRDACGRADAGLVSLAGVVGLLTPATSLVSAFDPGDAVASPAPSAIARAYRPESPPPRA